MTKKKVKKSKKPAVKPKGAAAGKRPPKAKAAPRKKAKKKVRKAVSEAKPPQAAKPEGRIAEGARAPSFTLPDQDGAMLSSRQLAGRPYVLYFYPKDDTPGCTREACGFRDDWDRFERAGVRVVGVSPDKPDSHRRFRQKYELPFSLLSDAERKLAKSYGSWVKKQNYGREYMGIERSTFLVDGSGKVRKVWRSVKVDGHVDKVLDAVESLV